MNHEYNIIFLDVDGVLNCFRDFKGRSIYVLNKRMIKRLHRIIKETCSIVVLSSTWRRYMSMRKYLVDNGVYFVDCTPDLGVPFSSRRGRRGAEIDLWVRSNPGAKVKNYVILDDENDFLDHQQDFFVQTAWLDGMQDEHVDRAIKILKTTGKEHDAKVQQIGRASAPDA